MFFDGSAAEAIGASRQQLRPLIVLLTGFDQGSRQVQDALIGQEQEEFAVGSVVLVLEDDLSNTNRAQFPDAKNFRAFCPVERLPTVVMVSPAGATLAKVEGVAAAGELRQQLATAYAAFRQQQQQRLLAAQTTLFAMAAVAPTAAAADGGPAGTPALPLLAAAAEEAGDDENMPPLEDEVRGESDGNDVPVLEGEQPAAAPAGAAAVSAAPSTLDQAAAPLAAEPQLEPEQPDPASLPFRLQFKFTNASVLRGDFTGATTLGEVFAWIDGERAAVDSCRGLAYVLVQAAPRLVLGAAQEAQSLLEAGLQPHTSLQVIPHAAQGHRPPLPPEAEPAASSAAGADAEVAQGEGKQQAGQDAVAAGRASSQAGRSTDVQGQQERVRAEAAASTVAQQRQREARAMPKAVPLPSPPPTEVQLRVRLSNGDTLCRTFPTDSHLAAVLDWLDAERTDRGPYKLCQPFPKRTFCSGDLGKSLLELGLDARTSLQLDLLPSRAKGKAATPAAPAPAWVPSAEELAKSQKEADTAAAATEAAKVPGVFTLQFKLTNGKLLRGNFPPEATLQEVCHYLDTHRTDGGVPYVLVQPFPKRRFDAEDLPQPLQLLGLQPRQVLLLEPLGGGTGGWSMRGALCAAASYFNPYSYLRGPSTGTPRKHATAVAAKDVYSAVASASVQAQGQDALLPNGSGSGEQQQHGARKRALGGGGRGGGGAGGSNIHTLGSGGGSGRDEENDGHDPGNTYWNGNSTEFGAPPPGQQ